MTAADAGLFGLFGRGKKKAAPVVRQSLVVFPFDASATITTPEGFGGQIAGSLRDMMAGEPGYMILVYREALAPIRRATEDQSLKRQDVVPPYSEEKSKSLRLAQTLAADLYLVGAIEDYQFDLTKKVAQLTLSAEMYNVNTGKLIGKFLVSGKADETSKATDEDELRAVAAGKAIEALKNSVIAKPEEAKATEAAPATEAAQASETPAADTSAAAEQTPAPPAVK